MRILSVAVRRAGQDVGAALGGPYPRAFGARLRRARRRELLQLASEAFASHGFREVRMDALADRLKSSKPQMYEVCGSKQTLFVAVMERELRHLEHSLAMHAGEGALAAAGSPEEAAFLVVRALFEHHRIHPHGFRVLFGALNWRIEMDMHEAARDRICGLAAHAMGLHAGPLDEAFLSFASKAVVTAAIAHLDLAYEQRISVIEAQDLTRDVIAVVAEGMPAETRRSIS